ncbi:MAG: hypothetical protein M9909_09575 [Thermomicrobiales bacterium]|nr:hypothetical protein [Thermomicrobiales bacterium]
MQGIMTFDDPTATAPPPKLPTARTDTLERPRHRHLPADMRAALVDYFRDEASIMIATEAAIEGVSTSSFVHS